MMQIRAKQTPDFYAVARRRMVKDQLRAKKISDKRVLAAFERVQRHLFVRPGMEDQAYLDRSLPISEGQTISQPIMVALQTELLNIEPDHRILEIGTGSGYQTAILAELASEVYTIERIRALSIQARKVLFKLRYENLQFRIGDGTLGWESAGPFNGIIVTAGAPVVPDNLKNQLADGGKLVIPVGNEGLQELLLISRLGDKFLQEKITACRFVKLIGEQGWRA